MRVGGGCRPDSFDLLGSAACPARHFAWLPARRAAGGGERPLFPGMIADEDLPAELKVVRIFLFLVLFLWPTGVHVFLTGQAFSYYRIVTSDTVDRP
jgi:hypothetical protein